MTTLHVVPTIPAQRRPLPEITHPPFCDPRLCRTDDVNVSHRARPEKWCAAESDTKITVGLEQIDELALSGPPEQFVYAPTAKVQFEDTASIYRASYVGQEYVIEAHACLDAADCRRLAAELLALADRLDSFGGAR